MLMEYGYHDGLADWAVTEKIACGYVRVYDVTGGEVRCVGEDYSCDLVPGKLYLLPSAVPYFLRQNPQNWLHCTYLHIDIAPDLLREVVELDAPPGSIPRGILDAFRPAALVRDRRVAAALAAALEEYCRGRHLFTSPEGEIAKVLAAIAGDIRKNWTVRELSRMAGYSEAYFIRRFRAETGVSPHQYLIARRMKEALRLLWDGLPVSEVAANVGYPELKAFSRSFHQWYGISPSQYRGSGKLMP